MDIRQARAAAGLEPLPDTKRRQLVVPIRPDVAAVVYVPYPMSEGDWGQFMTVLLAMKPGLVGPGTAGKDGKR